MAICGACKQEGPEPFLLPIKRFTRNVYAINSVTVQLCTNPLCESGGGEMVWPAIGVLADLVEATDERPLFFRYTDQHRWERLDAGARSAMYMPEGAPPESGK